LSETTIATPNETVGEALTRFFARHGIDRAGYRAPRFRVQLGRLRLSFPNPGWLPFHDLHHVALDLPPTFWGEVEVSAYELRSGSPTALITFLCLGALFFGLLVGPRRVARAWARYRGTKNLYGGFRYDDLVARELGDLRRELGLVGASAALSRQ
jgi:hypothetical protein